MSGCGLAAWTISNDQVQAYAHSDATEAHACADVSFAQPFGCFAGLAAGGLSMTVDGGKVELRSPGSFATFQRGDAVMLSEQNPMPGAVPLSFEGEVLERMPLRLKLREDFPAAALSRGPWRVDKLGNRIGFERGIGALKRMVQSHTPSNGEQKPKNGADAELVALIERPSEEIAGASVWRSFGFSASSNLVEQMARSHGCNPSQADAVQQATRRRLTLVQGPPGTGKTHCAVEIVLAWLRDPIIMQSGFARSSVLSLHPNTRCASSASDKANRLLDLHDNAVALAHACTHTYTNTPRGPRALTQSYCMCTHALTHTHVCTYAHLGD